MCVNRSRRWVNGRTLRPGCFAVLFELSLSRWQNIATQFAERLASVGLDVLVKVAIFEMQILDVSSSKGES